MPALKTNLLCIHNHPAADELFLVLQGVLKIELENSVLTLNAGEMVVIPKGLNYKPVAEEEVRVLLFEPAGTLNTGNISNERTISEVESI